jgi:hypothetical protein
MGCRLDGNLVVYRTNGTAAWASRTKSKPTPLPAAPAGGWWCKLLSDPKPDDVAAPFSSESGAAVRCPGWTAGVGTVTLGPGLAGRDTPTTG